ncbi:unnamed protein product [Arctogadus glacialis]
MTWQRIRDRKHSDVHQLSSSITSTLISTTSPTHRPLTLARRCTLPPSSGPSTVDPALESCSIVLPRRLSRPRLPPPPGPLIPGCL